MRVGIAFVAAVAAASAFAKWIEKIYAPWAWPKCHIGQPGVAEPPHELYSKIPEVYQTPVRLELERKAEVAARAEACEKFNLVLFPDDWTVNCGRGMIVSDANGKCYKYDKVGRVVQFGNYTNFEELVWCRKRQNELIAVLWNDQKIVEAAISNAVEPVASSSLLEELIPLAEAMELAKEGKGRGFYQLAIRYSRGEGLPRDERAAYKMLCRARDAEYANAVLIEGICDEAGLVEELRSSSGRYFLSLGPSPQADAMRGYCGTVFYDNGHRDLEHITNTVAFARVMGKYKRARSLGALAATNQIAALNRRLADFADKAAAASEAEENNRRLAGLFGEDARQTAKDDAAAREKALRKAEAERRKAEEQAAERSRFGSAFRDITGYEMGQKVAEDMESGRKSGSPEKRYRYFDSHELEYVDGCLYGIVLRFKSNGKYSLKSLDAEAEAVGNDLAARFGVEFEKGAEFKRGIDKRFSESAWKSGWSFYLRSTPEEGGMIRLTIEDATLAQELRRRLNEKKEALKESLPVFSGAK